MKKARKTSFMRLILVVWVSTVVVACTKKDEAKAAGESNSNRQADVVIHTSKGKVGIALYDETPIHRDNFLKLSREGYYDSVRFHRIIRDFMVQVGDPRYRGLGKIDEEAPDGPGYDLPAEIIPGMIHTRGKLAAARYPDQINPEWRSSGSQFYIITGQSIDAAKLDEMQQNIQAAYQGRLYNQFQEETTAGTFSGSFNDYLVEKNYQPFAYTSDQRKAYYRQGGAPWLDAQYTIFGEVVSGMHIVADIGNAKTNKFGQPMEAIFIESIEILSAP